MQVRLPHKHISLTQLLRVPALLIYLPGGPIVPRGLVRLRAAGGGARGRGFGLGEEGEEVGGYFGAHPVVAVRGEVEAVVPVFLAAFGGEGVVGDRGVEVEGVAGGCFC